jgi:hypothetical protein
MPTYITKQSNDKINAVIMPVDKTKLKNYVIIQQNITANLEAIVIKSDDNVNNIIQLDGNMVLV